MLVRLAEIGKPEQDPLRVAHLCFAQAIIAMFSDNEKAGKSARDMETGPRLKFRYWPAEADCFRRGA